jgi:hypothetical protein
MKKTILKLAFFLALIGVSTFLVSMIYRKMENKKVVAKNTKKLPTTQVKGLDSKSLQSKTAITFLKCWYSSILSASIAKTKRPT